MVSARGSMKEPRPQGPPGPTGLGPIEARGSRSPGRPEKTKASEPQNPSNDKEPPPDVDAIPTTRGKPLLN